jgi:23S rRNA (adenine2030-N6)-methyltransferase
MLKAELLVREVIVDRGLAGSGLILVNPPWPLADELNMLGPALCNRLRRDDGARWSLDWLSALD